MPPLRIALVGDFSPSIIAHRAINDCFKLAAGTNANPLQPEWLATDKITPTESLFKGLRGIWCVPGSPYANTPGALWAIEYARTNSVPFLGTCGGYQHALLEFARNVLGLKDAGHAEEDPQTPLPLLDRMPRPLIEESQPIAVTLDLFQKVYGAKSGSEMFHCSYGLNPKYESIFERSGLQIAARSDEGQARAIQLKGHPFFVGTHFQPERRALSGTLHPVVQAFFTAVETARTT